MDLFSKAKTIRLLSHHEKYLHSSPPDAVVQDRDAFSPHVKWAVEITSPPTHVRLRTPEGLFLTASDDPFLLGATGNKVTLSSPARPGSAVLWEPVRDGFQIKLRSRYGLWLRANGGFPPWRNSVTHDVPHRAFSGDFLWDVEVVEIAIEKFGSGSGSGSGFGRSNSFDEISTTLSLSKLSPQLSRQKSTSLPGSPRQRDGRTIHYYVANEDGHVDESREEQSFIFEGFSLEDLRLKLEEETGLEDAVLCTRSPLNGKLCPLRLQLPPNNAAVCVIVVQSSWKVAQEFENSS